MRQACMVILYVTVISSTNDIASTDAVLRAYALLSSGEFTGGAGDRPLLRNAILRPWSALISGLDDQEWPLSHVFGGDVKLTIR